MVLFSSHPSSLPPPTASCLLPPASCLFPTFSVCSLNDAGLTALIYEGEKNSFKYSGLGGSRMGAAGLMRFLRKKAFLVKTNSVPDPWWFDHQ